MAMLATHAQSKAHFIAKGQRLRVRIGSGPGKFNDIFDVRNRQTGKLYSPDPDEKYAMIKSPAPGREMVMSDQFPIPSKPVQNAPRSMPGFPGFPAPGNPGNGSSRALLPPSSCSMRNRVTLREVAASISGSSGGLTLSESIRQSGKVFEEQEARVKQLSQLTQVDVMSHSSIIRRTSASFSMRSDRMLLISGTI